MFHRPAFFRGVFGAGDQTDARGGKAGWHRYGRQVERPGQAEVSQEIFPKPELVVLIFAKIARHPEGMGEQWAGAARAADAKTLAAAGQPGFEISAQGIRK